VAAVTVLRFPNVHGADNALVAVQDLQAHHQIELHDAAIVTWPAGKKTPVTRQPVKLAASRSVGGAFWSTLFGLIFFTPYLGLDVGISFGAFEDVFRDYVIDEAFVARARAAITQGTSALFLMTNETIAGEIKEAMKNLAFDVIATNVSPAQEPRHSEACSHD
jgi:uncharacterized membrane protein